MLTSPHVEYGVRGVFSGNLLRACTNLGLFFTRRPTPPSPSGLFIKDVHRKGEGVWSKSRHGKGGCMDLVLWIRPKIPKILRTSFMGGFFAATNCNLLQIRGQLGDRKRRRREKTIPSLFVWGRRRHSLVGSWNIWCGGLASSHEFLRLAEVVCTRSR